mmetsp:Transcript_21086/g.31838  ORF Transcript_21086/g.31838 Transcript_21086/m.31838 type:complete len:153 (-) Transcript_21086:2689-3147(-)
MRGLGRGRNHGQGRGRGGRNDQKPAKLTDAELAAKPGGKQGDKWNGVDISNLKASFVTPVFNKFPPWLRVKISKAKNGTDFSRYASSTTSQQSTDNSDLKTELAQLRAIMQAQAAIVASPTGSQVTAQTFNQIDDTFIATQQSAGTRFCAGA